MEIKITKMNKLYEVNNDMCHNYYYICYGKIMNDNNTRYRKFKYIEWFDIFNVMEFFEKDYVTNQDIKEYAGIICESCLPVLKSYDDIDGLKEFYKWCNDTIENYNRIN